jgi:hypothetical protein
MQRLDEDLKEQIERISGPALRELKDAVAGVEQPLAQASVALTRSVECLERIVVETETRAVVREEVTRAQQQLRTEYSLQMQSMINALATEAADTPAMVGATRPEVSWETVAPDLIRRSGSDMLVGGEMADH